MLSPLLTLGVFIVGILVGSVGIGGVLLPLMLNYIGGIPLHSAIPACLLAYSVTGLAGSVVYAQHGSINWVMARRLAIGLLPGAYLGALLLPYVAAGALEMGIVILLLVSGLHALRQPAQAAAAALAPHQSSAVELTLVELSLLGLLVGTGSALSGTGGPLLLIPLLLWRRVAILTAIGLSQLVQIPISVMATLGNFMHNQVDVKLGLALGAALLVGCLLGAKAAHIVRAATLQKLVACLLLLTAVLMLVKLF